MIRGPFNVLEGTFMVKSLCVFVLFFPIISFSRVILKWNKIDTKENVEIFKGEIEDSRIVAFKGTSTIDASVPKVLSVIYDVSRVKEWMSDIKAIRLIQKISKFEKIEYNRTEAPWPVSDRDFVYQTKVHLHPQDKAVEILIESVNHKDVPPNKGVVRGHLYQSRYYLKSLQNNSKTFLEVEILADPKGSIPKWVVNLFQSRWPVSTVNGIRKIATEKNYQIHPDILESLQDIPK